MYLAKYNDKVRNERETGVRRDLMLFSFKFKLIFSFSS